MRKQGKYISDYRLVFKKGTQRDFIEKIKSKLGKSWKDIAEEIGISEYTLRFEWRNEKSTLLLSYTKKLAELSSLDFEDLINDVEEVLPKNWGQQLGVSKRNKRITKPIETPARDDPKLVEFIGAFLGDGHLFEYGLEFAGEARLDKNYFNHYLKDLISELFGLEPSTRVQENVLRLRYYSKNLSKWITKNFGFEPGKK